MKPALLDRLRTLDAEGSLPASRLPAAMRRELRALFDARILEERRAGAGRRVVVADPPGFRRWIEDRLPHGLDPDLAGSPRSIAVAAWRDAKVAARTDAEPVLIRAFTAEARLELDGAVLDILSLSHEAGCASFVLSPARQPTLQGRIGVVENLEAFLHAERLGPPLDAALYASGRLSSRVLAWMGAQGAVRWVHLGDYDPVGMSEYLRVSEACPGRATLWIPPELDALVARYGKPRLMEASPGVWTRVRQSEDPAVRRVVSVLDRHAAGLEQEILLRYDLPS